MEVATLYKCTSDNNLGIAGFQSAIKHNSKALWESLFNADAVSEQYDDKDLQSVALLTSTIFSIFRGLREKYEEVQKECKELEKNLKATLADLEATKKDAKIAKEAKCQQCMRLQKELLMHQEKLEQLKSITQPVLNRDNVLEDNEEQLTSHQRVQLICELIHSNLLGNGFSENKMQTNEKKHNYSKRSAMGERLSSRKKLFGMATSQSNYDQALGATLAAESCPNDENMPPDSLTYSGDSSPVDALHESLTNKRTRDTPSVMTPKKSTSSCDASLQSSPVLCSSNKKHKTSHFELSQKGSPSEFNCNRITNVLRNCSQDKSQTSPSLLNLDAIPENNLEEVNKHCNNKHSIEKVMMQDKGYNIKMMSHEEKQQQLNETKEKKLKTEVWRLKQKPGLTKLKQTTLSLAKPTTTVDLSKTPSFSAGMRSSNESGALINDANGGCDEETALATALQKSLTEVKIENNNETDTEEQDGIVNPSPTAGSSKLFLNTSSLTRSKTESLIKSKNVMKMHASQLDETLFVPLQTSSQIHEKLTKIKKEEPEEELARSMTQDVEWNIKETVETSFDRIPQKPSTSPNFKYRRQAVRKQALRQKLEGWDCAQCKNYYDALGDNGNHDRLKERMNVCSRHRDKYQFQFNTPPGFWDVDILDTQETFIESPKKNMQR